MTVTPGGLGIALLAFAPYAYRLRRGGRNRQLVVGSVVSVAAGAWVTSNVLLDAFAPTPLLAVVGSAVLAVALVLGWPRPGHGRPGVTAFEAGVLATLSHLFGAVVHAHGVVVPYPLVGPGIYRVATASATDVAHVLLVLGVTGFLLALSHARVHGPLPSAGEYGPGPDAGDTCDRGVGTDAPPARGD